MPCSRSSEMQANWLCQGKGNSGSIFASFCICLILKTSLYVLFCLSCFQCSIRRESSDEAESNNISPTHQTRLFTYQKKYFLFGKQIFQALHSKTRKKYFQVRSVTCDDFLFSSSATLYCDEAGGLIPVMLCSLESLKTAEHFLLQAAMCPFCLLVKFHFASIIIERSKQV